MTLHWQFLNNIQKALQLQHSRSSEKGFTLLELLVTALISGTIISGLLLLTNELLRTDQRESGHAETQRDLKTALDYIGAELKEAVYVYENAACIEGDIGNKCSGANSIINVGKVDALPQLANTEKAVPVLAFWKQSPLTGTHADQCATDTAPDVVPCLSGNAYSLVVYAYSEDANANGPWQGEAGIVRYEMGLTPDSLAGTDPQFGKYVAPNEVSVNFRGWPIENTAALGDPQILVDFIDNFQNDDGNGGDGYFATERQCPTNYSASPNNGGDADTFANDLGGFYVCVNSNANLTGNNNNTSSNNTSDPASYGNQDVIVYLRGNALGRSGLMVEETFLPVIETRHLVRGALNRQ